MKRMLAIFKPASQRVVESRGDGGRRGRGDVRCKVSVSSSQSSTDGIRKPSGLGLTIDEYASVAHPYRVQVPPLPPYCVPNSLNHISNPALPSRDYRCESLVDP